MVAGASTPQTSRPTTSPGDAGTDTREHVAQQPPPPLGITLHSRGALPKWSGRGFRQENNLSFVSSFVVSSRLSSRHPLPFPILISHCCFGFRLPDFEKRVSPARLFGQYSLCTYRPRPRPRHHHVQSPGCPANPVVHLSPHPHQPINNSSKSLSQLGNE